MYKCCVSHITSSWVIVTCYCTRANFARDVKEAMLKLTCVSCKKNKWMKRMRSSELMGRWQSRSDPNAILFLWLTHDHLLFHYILFYNKNKFTNLNFKCTHPNFYLAISDCWQYFMLVLRCVSFLWQLSIDKRVRHGLASWFNLVLVVQVTASGWQSIHCTKQMGPPHLHTFLQ